ncbi:unnamed protein product [Chilo suppressalis]|uniref:Large ribosomal subunit protein bL35m n=1 Tax=Chilo suppressalis TaxID=168631 RepID=A0ABN8B3P5_CHISP|nr:hypothetical protein evm_002666 [Chilo suppressalis]CAH0401604.1 unnamed protein product [Chilo suppressalis]
MFRYAISGLRAMRPLTTQYYKVARIIFNDSKSYVTNATLPRNIQSGPTLLKGSLFNNRQILDIANNINSTPVRTVTKFSLNKGKRKTANQVVKRFFRLHWGAWIRPKVGRQKKLWKKSSAQRRRLRQHVFCTKTQSRMLDKMVTKFWKRPKYYVDDPYAPYHTREEYYMTRKKPIIRE